MERALSVLLVEDDQKACKEIIEYVDEFEDITLVGVTNNSYKAVQLTQEFMPDAVILDLELHQGGGNGLTFLQDLHKMALSIFPYILVTTNNSSSVTYDAARELGADFIMAKHQAGYSAQSVIEFLRLMKNMIFSKTIAETGNTTTESPQQKTKRITRLISMELDHIGINPKSLGYRYLNDAIQIIIKQEHTINLCGIIGQKYEKTDSSVERAMQNAINRAWRSSDIDDLLKYYTAKIHSDKGVPTITEFIYYYANRIKNEL